MAVSGSISNSSIAISNATQISTRISTITKFKGEAASKVEEVQNKLQDAFSAVNDPIAASLKRILFKINSLVVNLENKINKLAEDAVKSVDNKGRVELIGSTIVITVTNQDVERARNIQENITRNIASINNTIRLLSGTLNTLNSIAQTVRAIQIALNIQEILLSLNPVTGSVFNVFKQAFKLIFLKDAMKEYSKVLINELQSNKASLDRLIARFRNLNIQIRIADDKNKGDVISPSQAENLLASELLSPSIETKNLYEEYRSLSDREYILIVERYEETQLIARAKDKFSGLLVTQTAPSFFSTGEQLLQELKNILDTEF